MRIEDEAFADSRYDRLALELGLPDADCARGKIARLWRQCTIEQSYTLDAKDVRLLLGDNGVDALILSRLGRSIDDKIYISGTKGRIEWLKKLRNNGKFGKRGGRPRKNPEGFSTKPRRVSENTENETPPAPAPAPAPAPPTPSAASGVSLVDFSAQLAKSGICIELSRTDRERYSKLVPVEQYEIDHGKKCAKAKKAGCGYVLSTIEGERQRAAELPDQPARSPPRETPEQERARKHNEWCEREIAKQLGEKNG